MSILSIGHLCYSLNIDLFDAVRLPLWEFYRQQVVPFVHQPFEWIGMDLGRYRSLIVGSGVGAYIWAGAEYRSNTYIMLYPFPQLQRRPGEIDLKQDWSIPPKIPTPPKWLSVRWWTRIPHKLFLTYSFLGLGCTIAGLASGIVTLGRYLGELVLFTTGTAIFVLQHYLAPLERMGDDNYWGTRVFLRVFNLRRGVDEKLSVRLNRFRFIRVDQIGSVRVVVEDILREAGRLWALVLLVLAVLVLFEGFSAMQ